MSHYKSNLRDIEFNLFEVFRAQERLGSGPYADMDVDTARTILEEVERLALSLFRWQRQHNPALARLADAFAAAFARLRAARAAAAERAHAAAQLALTTAMLSCGGRGASGIAAAAAPCLCAALSADVAATRSESLTARPQTAPLAWD